MPAQCKPYFYMKREKKVKHFFRNYSKNFEK